MRKITVSIDDETYRRSRVRAAELDTSVSALVRDFLERLVRAGRTGESVPPAETEPVWRGGGKAPPGAGRLLVGEADVPIT